MVRFCSKKQAALIKNVQPDRPASEVPLGVSAASWPALRHCNQAATAAHLRIPLLIMQGQRNYQVTREDLNSWKKRLGSRPIVRFKSYPKFNHLFMEGEGKAKAAEYDRAGHAAREANDEVVAWIKAHGSR
jgi:dienelactone hydrolase